MRQGRPPSSNPFNQSNNNRVHRTGYDEYLHWVGRSVSCIYGNGKALASSWCRRVLYSRPLSEEILLICTTRKAHTRRTHSLNNEHRLWWFSLIIWNKYVSSSSEITAFRLNYILLLTYVCPLCVCMCGYCAFHWDGQNPPLTMSLACKTRTCQNSLCSHNPKLVERTSGAGNRRMIFIDPWWKKKWSKWEGKGCASARARTTEETKIYNLRNFYYYRTKSQ